MFVGISVKNIFKSKWTYVVFLCLLVVGVLALSFKVQHIVLGKRVTSENVLDISKYYAEYDLTVVSNKNINTYFVKEEYLGGYHKFSFLDSLNYITEVTVQEGTVTLKNEKQKNSLIFNDFGLNESKLSLASIIKVYNIIKEGKNSCDCESEVYEKENSFFVHLYACGKAQDEFCINSILSDTHFSEIELEIDKETGVPHTIYVLDKNKNTLNCIVYTKFENRE